MSLFWLLSVLLLSLPSKCILSGSQPSSPESSQWKEFLNLSPERTFQMSTSSQTQPGRTVVKEYSQNPEAIYSRFYRQKMKSENLELYNAKKKQNSKRDYQVRMKKMESDPEAFKKYQLTQRENTKRNSYTAKAKLIENPAEKEEFIRKAREELNTKARLRYHLNKLYTGQGSNKRMQHKARKERIAEGTATHEDHEEVRKELERRRKWAQASKERKKKEAENQKSNL